MKNRGKEEEKYLLLSPFLPFCSMSQVETQKQPSLSYHNMGYHNISIYVKSNIGFRMCFWQFSFTSLLWLLLKISWCALRNPWIKNVLIHATYSDKTAAFNLGCSLKFHLSVTKADDTQSQTISLMCTEGMRSSGKSKGFVLRKWWCKQSLDLTEKQFRHNLF